MTSLSSEAVDQVCQMDDEEFRSVLEQLVHHKPQGDLVRGMCAEAAKDESFQVPASPAPGPSAWSQPPSLRKNHGIRNAAAAAALRSDHSQQKKQQQQSSDQNGLNSQSMQDLVSMECKSSGGKNSRKANKTRANSFTQEDSGSGKGAGSKSRHRSAVTPVPSSVSSESLTSRKLLTKSQSSAGTSGSTYPPQSPAGTAAGSSAAYSSATSPADPTAAASHSSSSTGTAFTSTTHSSSNKHADPRDCDVQSGLSSQSTHSDSNACHSNSYTSGHNGTSSGGASASGSRLLGAGPQPVICRGENVVEVMDNMVEMCDLRQRANIVNYSNSAYPGPTADRLSHDVDSLIPFHRLESQDVVDTQFAERRSLNQESGAFGNSSNARNGESSDDGHAVTSLFVTVASFCSFPGLTIACCRSPTALSHTVMHLTRCYFCEPCDASPAVAAMAELHYQHQAQEARRNDGESMLYLIRQPVSSNTASYVQCNDRDPSPCLPLCITRSDAPLLSQTQRNSWGSSQGLEAQSEYRVFQWMLVCCLERTTACAWPRSRLPV